MHINLRNSTKMGIQAAVAILIAEFLSQNFKLERGYWITLTAMALTAQTWGESLKRAFERVLMTILGGSLGTALYFLLPSSEKQIILVALLFFVFLAVYLFKIYNLLSVFFLTCFVVFLFALAGNWTVKMLELRIIDTISGAIIAIFVGHFLLPIKTNVNDMLSSYFYKLSAVLANVFQETKPRFTFSTDLLSSEFQKIKKNALSIRYELLFHSLSSQDFVKLLNNIASSTQYIHYLKEGYSWLLPHLSMRERRLIQIAAKTSQNNIQVLINHLKQIQGSDKLPTTDVQALLKQAIDEEPERFASLDSEPLEFFSLMYFFTQLNCSLIRIDKIITRTGLAKNLNAH